jgi:hypothetical protein
MPGRTQISMVNVAKVSRDPATGCSPVPQPFEFVPPSGTV